MQWKSYKYVSSRELRCCVISLPETARDVARFRRLMDDVHQQLENQLELQENSLKMVQSRIESKRELVEMLTTSAV